MNRSVIWFDVDSQDAFGTEGCPLYVDHPEIEVRKANGRALVARAIERGEPLLGTVDSHAYDSPEFAENGGPFPRHAVKGSRDWLKLPGTLPPRYRFVPMTAAHGPLLVGSAVLGDASNRVLTADDIVREARAGVGIYFEKEVYDVSINPFAVHVLDRLTQQIHVETGALPVVRVFGFCTGGYCVDAACLSIRNRIGIPVELVLDATVPIGGDAGEAETRAAMERANIPIITTEEALR